MFDFKVIEANKDKFVVEIEVEFDGEEEMEPIKFIVKPEDGVVIGIYEWNIYDELDSIRSRLNKRCKWAFDALVGDEGVRHSFTSCTVKAMAKCSGDDVFDEAFGKKLVEAKIHRKCHQKVLKMINSMSWNISKIQDEIDEAYAKHNAKFINLDKDINGYFMRRR